MATGWLGDIGRDFFFLLLLLLTGLAYTDCFPLFVHTRGCDGLARIYTLIYYGERVNE
jgi:hypothetical protein